MNSKEKIFLASVKAEMEKLVEGGELREEEFERIIKIIIESTIEHFGNDESRGG